MKRALLLLATLCGACGNGATSSEQIDMNGPAAQSMAVATFAAG